MIIASRTTLLSKTQKMVVVPLSDIHFNAPGHDRDRFLDIIKWVAEASRRPDRVMGVVLMGDHLDTLSGSERRAYLASNFHESTRATIEKLIMSHEEELMAALKPIAHCIWGVLDGNHTYKRQEADVSGADTGKTTGRILAERFKVPYFGMCGALVLQVKAGRNASGTGVSFKIFMHHGFGNASTKSASILQMTKLRERFPNMDLYIMGHNHTPIATVVQGIDVRPSHSGWRMVQRDQAFVRAGSFLKGYIDGQIVDGYSGSYVEEKCLVPQGLGVVTCNVRWRLKQVEARNGSRTNKIADGFSVHVQE